MAYSVRSFGLAGVCILTALAAQSAREAQAQGRPSTQQVLIETKYVEIGIGASSASGNLGFDYFGNNETKSFSTVRPFINFGFEMPGPRIGNANIVIGANSQIFLTPKIADVTFQNIGGADVNVVAKNLINVTPFLAFDVPFGDNPLTQPRLRLFAGPTFADQVITADIDNGFNREHVSNSKITVSPTVGVELVQPTVAVPQGRTLILGDLNIGIKARGQVTFPQSVPGLSDVPFIGSAFRQNRNAEVSGQLMIFITPQIVKADEP